MYHLPNINSSTFTLSAIIVGFMLIGDLNSTEQNALGNWFMLVGQTLETSGNFVFNGERQNTTSSGTNTNQNKITDTNEIKQTIDMLTKTIAAMQKEINNLKKYNC